MPLLGPVPAWHAPVPGPVVRAFRFAPGRPYVGGQRRGVDLAAPRGRQVGAACAGVVTFAGRLPTATGTRDVTVRCRHGGLVATHLGLIGVAVRRGTTVRAGSRLGAAAGPVLRLGARRAGERHGYVDPAALLGGARAPGRAPPAVAPAPAPRRGPPRGAPPARAVHRPGSRVRVPPAAAAADLRAPLLAWLGLAALALGVPAGGALRARS